MSQNDLNNHIWHIHLRTTVCPNKFVNRASHAWAQPNWNAAVESWGAAEAAAALFKSNPHPPRCHGRPLSFPRVRLSGTVYLSKALPTVRSSASASSSCPASPPPSRANPRNCRRRSPIISSIHKWPIDVNCSDYTKIGLNLPGCQRLRKFPTMIRARPTKQPPPPPLMMTPHLCPVPSLSTV